MGLAEVETYHILRGATTTSGKREDNFKLILWLKADDVNPSVRSAWLIFNDAEMKEHGLGYVAGDSIVAFFPPSWFPHYYTMVHQERQAMVVWQQDDNDQLEIFSVEAQSGDAASMRQERTELLTAPTP